MKIKTRKKPKQLAGAKENFCFDDNLEFTIYYFLCKGKVERRYRKKISGFMFEKYADWKGYIIEKYQKYGYNELIEFSRYLNQGIREKKTFSPMVIMYFSPAVSYFMTRFVETAFSQNSDIADFLMNIGTFIISIIALMLIAHNLYLKENMRANFYEDYKEIIDELIEKKNKV